jgi:hypothetical protein
MTRAESGDSRDLADELGRTDAGDAVDLSQVRRRAAGSGVEFSLEAVDVDRQLTDPLD